MKKNMAIETKQRRGNCRQEVISSISSSNTILYIRQKTSSLFSGPVDREASSLHSDRLYNSPGIGQLNPKNNLIDSSNGKGK